MSKKVNIGGIDVTVVSNAEAEKCEMILCRRVADLPIPSVPSQIVNCINCDARVWVSNHAPVKPARWCLQCGAAEIEKQGEDK